MKHISALSCAIVLLLFSSHLIADQMLAMRSGCLGCHGADTKLIGPSFKDIAAKYKGDAAAVDQLAAKVTAGSQAGAGIWGDAAMPPSPAAPEDIKSIVGWIIGNH